MDNAQAVEATSKPLEASVVTSILSSEPTKDTPFPQEHLPSPLKPHLPAPHTRYSSTGSLGPDGSSHTSQPSRDKRHSVNTAAGRPFQHRSTTRHRGAASVSILPTNLGLTPAPVEVETPPDDDFLTALAAQERRVLELREELHKAEQQLLNFKKSWASQEASRRRNPVQRLKAMRPKSAGASPRAKTRDDEDGSSAWMYEEMERRKNAIARHNRSGHRRVFSGSRDIIPLKLVSPYSKRLSAPALSATDPGVNVPNQGDYRSATRITRSSTMPAFGDPIPEEYPTDRSPSPYKGGVNHVRKGTQIVSDFREGLWTFFEDLRQATVGEDARPAEPQREIYHQPRKKHSPKGSRNATRHEPRPHDDATLIDIGGAFWKDHGLNMANSPETPHREAKSSMRQSTLSQQTARTTTSKKHTKRAREVALHTRYFEGEAWDTWDTPEKSSPIRPRSNSSASPAQHSPSTDREASSRTSSQSSVGCAPTVELGSEPDSETDLQSGIDGRDNKDDATSWPAFTKRASMLRSSAMHLMDEWERSLNPTAPEVPASHK